MRPYVKAAVIMCFVLLLVAPYVYRFGETNAQKTPEQPYLSANQQKAEFPTNVGLNCTGCHGPGTKLPYLAGEQFHKDTHGAITASIHAKSGANGKPAPSCVNCHAVNGDMTTMLPAEDPRSTRLNRGGRLRHIR